MENEPTNELSARLKLRLKHAPWRSLRQVREHTSIAGERFRRAMRREMRISPKLLRLDHEQVNLQTSDGLRLSGWFVPKAQEGRFSRHALGVVLHHHYGGQKAATLPWIRQLQRLGVDTLAFDARGHGSSSARPIGIDCFVQRAADVEAAIDEIRRRGAERVICLGQSQGASIVAFACGKRSDVDAVIFDSGPPPTMEVSAWGLAVRCSSWGACRRGLQSDFLRHFVCWFGRGPCASTGRSGLRSSDCETAHCSGFTATVTWSFRDIGRGCGTNR
jgi:pimeloyl-ACP methyl ester carboxylesterase